MTTNTDVSKALYALGVTRVVLRGQPTNEAEFNEMFRKITGADEKGQSIESNNPSDFGVTWSQITAKQAELKADYEAKEYQRKRVSEYPSIADQLDDLYHNGIDGWKKTIKAVKDKYPKD